MYRCAVFVNEFLLLNEHVQCRGVKFIGNLEGGSFSHLKKMERKAVRLWGKTIGKTIPLRMKKMVIFNVSTKNLLYFKNIQLYMQDAK